MMDTASRLCTMETSENCIKSLKIVRDSCKDFHLNQGDCDEMMSQSVKRIRAEIESKQTKQQ